MHNGYYIEKEERGVSDFNFLKRKRFKDLDGYSIYFEDDEHRPYKATPMDYLHGKCDVFASFIKRHLGYPIYAIKKDGHIVHVFNMVEKNGENLYIDVRGITNDFEEFICEYSKECSKKMIESYTEEGMWYYLQSDEDFLASFMKRNRRNYEI